MTAHDHKQTLQAIHAALAEGDGRPLIAAMRDDFCWTLSGQGPWARTWRGKEAVLRDLLAPLNAQFATRYRSRARNFIAEGDTVVVECKGDVATKAGDRYDNDYCFVYRFADDGKLIALTEYMDTALAERVLVGP